MRYGMPLMSSRCVIHVLYVYVVAVVYAALYCSHGPCYNETTRCRNIKYSSLTRYPSLFDISAFRGSWNNHSINMLPWHSFHPRVRKPIINVNFEALWLISKSKYKNTGDTYPMAYGWFIIGIYWTNKNGVCQLFLKFAYWVAAFWIRWPDYFQPFPSQIWHICPNL